MPRRMIDSQFLQAQKVQSLGTLAGGVAHEFNNILTGIMGYAGLGAIAWRGEKPTQATSFSRRCAACRSERLC